MSFALAFAFAVAHRLYLIDVFKLSPYVATAFADMPFFVGSAHTRPLE